MSTFNVGDKVVAQRSTRHDFIAAGEVVGVGQHGIGIAWDDDGTCTVVNSAALRSNRLENETGHAFAPGDVVVTTENVMLSGGYVVAAGTTAGVRYLWASSSSPNCYAILRLTGEANDCRSGVNLNSLAPANAPAKPTPPTHSPKCWRCPQENHYQAPNNHPKGFLCGECRILVAMMGGEPAPKKSVRIIGTGTSDFVQLATALTGPCAYCNKLGLQEYFLMASGGVISGKRTDVRCPDHTGQCSSSWIPLYCAGLPKPDVVAQCIDGYESMSVALARYVDKKCMATKMSASQSTAPIAEYTHILKGGAMQMAWRVQWSDGTSELVLVREKIN